MKALLKEKRFSLRSLFRRSLVILSVSALILAACNSSDSNSGGGTNGGGGGTAPVRVVSAISILQQPVEDSYQGCPPNLTGLIVEIVWADNGQREVVAYDPTKFFTVPGYMDEPGDNGGAGFQIGLGYVGSTAVTNELRIGFVWNATKLHITGEGVKDWYSDRRPDYSGLSYEVEFDPVVGYTTSTGPGTDYFKWTYHMSSAYPKFDLSEAKDLKRIRAWIGSTGAGSYLEASFAIQNYYDVSGVEFVSATFGDVFDDDTDLFGGVTCAGAGSWTLGWDPVKAIDAVKSWKPRFRVFYFGGTSREIDIDEFLGNNGYYVNELGMDASNFSASAALSYRPENSIVANDGIDTTTGFLTVDEDTGNWNLTLEYVPAYYLITAATPTPTDGTAWVSHVDVPVPLWVFDNQASVRKNTAAGTNNIRTVGDGGTPAAMEDGLLEAINAKWILTANYSKGRDRMTREIEFTDQMFYDGYYMVFGAGMWTLSDPTTYDPTGAGTVINLDDTNANPANYWFDAAIPTLSVGRDWPLPLVFRTELLELEDSVQIDIIGS